MARGVPARLVGREDVAGVRRFCVNLGNLGDTCAYALILSCRLSSSSSLSVQSPGLSPDRSRRGRDTTKAPFELFCPRAFADFDFDFPFFFSF